MSRYLVSRILKGRDRLFVVRIWIAVRVAVQVQIVIPLYLQYPPQKLHQSKALKWPHLSSSLLSTKSHSVLKSVEVSYIEKRETVIYKMMREIRLRPLVN